MAIGKFAALCDDDGGACCGSSRAVHALTALRCKAPVTGCATRAFPLRVEGRGRSAAGVAGATMPVHRAESSRRAGTRRASGDPRYASHTRLRRADAHLHAAAPARAPAVAGRLGPGGEHAAQGQRGARRRAERDGGAAAPLRTDPALADAIARAEQEALSELQRANLREIRRDWRRANALPESLVQRRQLAGSRCEHAWRVQRPANDWKGFLGNFREVLAIAREEAALLSERSGLSRYDALMDRFEPGMTSATVDRVFGEVRQWLPGLIRQVRERQAREPLIQPVGSVPGGRAAPPVRTGDPPARLRLRGRPAGREHAPVLRRRARGRAHDHALSRGRFPRQPDGHGARNRPWPLRAEPAARLARPAGGRGALDGAARKPVAELRDAARQPPRLRRAAGTAGCAQPSATSRPSSRATCTG